MKMNYKIIGALVVIGGLVLIARYELRDTMHQVADYKNASYAIEGRSVTLASGIATIQEQEGGSVSEVRYFGNEVVADFNEDSYSDVAFILTQSGSGSGTFYYLVVALGDEKGYRGTNAMFLGDRIAPQTTEFRDGVIVVNFADRGVGEPMTARPSIGVTRRFSIQSSMLVSAQ